MGSTSESFCLKWNDFHADITAEFSGIRASNHLLDVTVRCGDTSLQAHRLILSSCSRWFRDVICSLPPAILNPVLVIWDASPKDLQMIFDFMYNGEVNVQQENLNSFLALAERLQVHGLTQRPAHQADSAAKHDKSGTKEEEVAAAAASSSSYILDLPGENFHQPVLPRKRRKSLADNLPDMDDIQEVNRVEHAVKEEISDTQGPGELAQYSGYDEYYDNYYEKDFEEEPDSGGRQPCLPRPPPNITLDATKGMPTHGGTCPICFKFIGTNVRRHMEDLHFPTSTPCTVCGKVFTSTNKMRSHKAYAHRGVS